MPLLRRSLLALIAALVAGHPGIAEEVPSFSFVVWGHPYRGDGLPPHHFEEILQRIAALQPAFLVLTGDMIHGQYYADPVDRDALRADWERLDAGLARLGIPVYRTPGNHDIHNRPTLEVYLERYPRPPLAIPYRNCLLILLDSLGIDRHQDQEGHWLAHGGEPLDDAQVQFIAKALESQDQYDHVFLFMHHNTQWRDPSAAWWEQVHPLLRGGKTRAVFSGDPWENKYEHMEVDGIHYIVSAVQNRRDDRFLLEGGPGSWGTTRQIDTLQQVRVHGDAVDIETIPVGTLTSDYLSPRFWQGMQEEYARRHSRWTTRTAAAFHERFENFRHLLAFFGLEAAVCFVLGAGAAMLWLRGRGRGARVRPAGPAS